MTDISTFAAADVGTFAAGERYPIPAGRGRWRITLHNRNFAANVTYQNTMIVELTQARARKLTKTLSKPAQFDFTINGASEQAPAILELATDIYAWRWDGQQGKDVCMFRGVIDHTEDAVTEEADTVTVTAHDTLAMLARRMATDPQVYTQIEQSTIVANLVYWAQNGVNGYDYNNNWSGWPTPGSQLFITPQWCNPDGTNAPASSRLRDYTASGNADVLGVIDALANMIDGFEYDVTNDTANYNPTLRMFYPQQGVQRDDCPLMYGASVSAFTRTVSSDDYANWVRVIGNNGTADPAAAQFASQTWNQDANNVSVNPVGLWMMGSNESDVSVQSTLNDKAAGLLNLNGILVPTYTITLRPNWYRYHYPNMGDWCPFIANVGRLNINTYIRVVGIEYDIGDDYDENVVITLGRPKTQLASLFNRSQRDIDALARR